MAAALKLISHKLCPYVQRAVIALNEKGVPFERIDIDLANKPDWFLKISPLGKVPVLTVPSDNGEVAVFESNLIQDALKTTRGNRARAARFLSTTERIINYKIRRYGIDPRRFRG